jgi:hypothetical protein
MPSNAIGKIAGKAAVLAILVCVGVLVAGSAGAAAKHGPITSVIKIKQKPNGEPYFKVPNHGNIPPGNLEIVNKTNPHKIGPHTFSLVTADSVPKGRDEIKACAKLKPDTICQAIADWHEVTFGESDFHVGKKSVEAGNPGWDTEGDLNNTGDSQFFLKKDDDFSRPTSVSPPTTLHFMCAVHPEMHGKVTIGAVR